MITLLEETVFPFKMHRCRKRNYDTFKQLLEAYRKDMEESA